MWQTRQTVWTLGHAAIVLFDTGGHGLFWKGILVNQYPSTLDILLVYYLDEFAPK